MASINYKVVRLDLATVRSEPGEALLGAGVAYDGVTVLALPAGAVCSLAFGENKDQVPLTQEGTSYEFLDPCGNPYSVDETLRFSNPAGGGTVVLLVSIGSGAGSLSTT